MKNFKTFEGYLNSILEARQARNPAYTMSAFARQLNIPASRFSEILKGKIGISVKRAIEIAETLQLNEKDKAFFINLVQAEHDRSPAQREKSQNQIMDFFDKYIEIECSRISNWYHLALIELIAIQDKLSTEELALRLGLSLEITTDSIKELLEMKVISANPHSNGFFISDANRESAMDIPTECVKQLNEQILKKAALELRAQDVSNRDFSIAVFGLNKEQLSKAKERIKHFRRDLMKEFESFPNKDAVYCLSTQFFEMTTPEVKNGELVISENKTF